MKKSLWIIFIIVIVFSLTACTTKQAIEPVDNNPVTSESAVVSVTSAPIVEIKTSITAVKIIPKKDVTSLPKKGEIIIHIPNADATAMDSYSIAGLTADQSTPAEALAILMQGVTLSDGNKLQLVNLPIENNLINKLEIKEGIAYVDINAEAYKKAKINGSAGESAFVDGVVNTLTEYPEVTSVQFLQDGKIVVDWGGNYAYDVPFTRSIQ
ncbi:MAG: GerMN domain-containing protein [Clostridia bacterium]